MRTLKAFYAPMLRLALKWRWLTVGLAAAALAGAVWVFSGLGAVFVPQLDEGSLGIEIVRLPSISLEQAVVMEEQVEKALLEFPEVEKVFARTGTAEVANDPQGPYRTDVWVMLKPRNQWRTAHTREDLVAAYRKRLEKLPGQSYGFSQPIELRFKVRAGANFTLGRHHIRCELEKFWNVFQSLGNCFRNRGWIRRSLL
jgi:cobalt-zinc-cadmium resistance protein CzcA